MYVSIYIYMLYIRKQECNIYRVFQKFIYKLRNSFPKAFFKKCVLQKCSKYTGETLIRKCDFSKVA